MQDAQQRVFFQYLSAAVNELRLGLADEIFETGFQNGRRD